ncbi:hypothetical protein VOLCADRAFT_96364 [Volvox carteri f. nagariensis]|uniref:Uncharacterized protein n=1 Tax=Volvox carteri f. nagariensis TaxID=3068 RepID=D8U9X5_VOLCA|nr:uncharacterized protein VOLCADRAFT_96364 [Volvox carteri f. nagariensis]EFJ43550.1 hypothetical protein VOLCADRAFT_96364 [Volvox carteri f. nagariensis]|eukprot:XP_002955479.1 hypothetical protein VOLCADRAFT_96364 [Volvox carteri f. nagariensis]
MLIRNQHLRMRRQHMPEKERRHRQAPSLLSRAQDELPAWMATDPADGPLQLTGQGSTLENPQPHPQPHPQHQIHQPQQAPRELPQEPRRVVVDSQAQPARPATSSTATAAFPATAVAAAASPAAASPVVLQPNPHANIADLPRAYPYQLNGTGGGCRRTPGGGGSIAANLRRQRSPFSAQLQPQPLPAHLRSVIGSVADVRAAEMPPEPRAWYDAKLLAQLPPLHAAATSPNQLASELSSLSRRLDCAVQSLSALSALSALSCLASVSSPQRPLHPAAAAAAAAEVYSGGVTGRGGGGTVGGLRGLPGGPPGAGPPAQGLDQGGAAGRSGDPARHETTLAYGGARTATAAGAAAAAAAAAAADSRVDVDPGSVLLGPGGPYVIQRQRRSEGFVGEKSPGSSGGGSGDGDGGAACVDTTPPRQLQQQLQDHQRQPPTLNEPNHLEASVSWDNHRQVGLDGAATVVVQGQPLAVSGTGSGSDSGGGSGGGSGSWRRYGGGGGSGVEIGGGAVAMDVVQSQIAGGERWAPPLWKSRGGVGQPGRSEGASAVVAAVGGVAAGSAEGRSDRGAEGDAESTTGDGAGSGQRKSGSSGGSSSGSTTITATATTESSTRSWDYVTLYPAAPVAFEGVGAAAVREAAAVFGGGDVSDVEASSPLRDGSSDDSIDRGSGRGAGDSTSTSQRGIADTPSSVPASKARRAVQPNEEPPWVRRSGNSSSSKNRSSSSSGDRARKSSGGRDAVHAVQATVFQGEVEEQTQRGGGGVLSGAAAWDDQPPRAVGAVTTDVGSSDGDDFGEGGDDSLHARMEVAGASDGASDGGDGVVAFALDVDADENDDTDVPEGEESIQLQQQRLQQHLEEDDEEEEDLLYSGDAGGVQGGVQRRGPAAAAPLPESQEVRPAAGAVQLGGDHNKKSKVPMGALGDGGVAHEPSDHSLSFSISFSHLVAPEAATRGGGGGGSGGGVIGRAQHNLPSIRRRYGS